MSDTAPPQRPKGHDRVLAGWLWRDYIRPWLPLLLLSVLFMGIDGAMTGALSLMLKPMFDDVLVARDGGAIWWVAGGVAGTFIIRAFTSLCHRTLTAYIGNKVVTSMQSRLTAHLMTLDQSFHHTHPPGHLIDRVRGDTTEILAVFDRLLTGAGRDLISVFVLVGVALYTDWLWTVVALIGMPLLVLPAAILQRIVRKMGVAARTASAAASTRLDEIFHGVVTIQRASLEAHESARLGSTLNRFVKARVRTAAGEAMMGSMSNIVAAIGFALVLVLAGGQIVDGERTVGEFMAFFAAISLLFEPLRRLGAMSGAWQTVLASADRVHALLQVQPKITQPAAELAPLPAPGREEIRFENVTFAYDDTPVLRGLTLTAEPGKTTALVGASGAGKSTLFALLTRLADPQGGRITLGGEDIRQMDLPGLRALFSVVAQDNALFDETLRDNVLLGATDITDAQLHAALEAAHVTEFLPSLPDGLDTRVGPRGSALSGGQRQRVAIARALLRPAPILLLDEATSALDARSEALIQTSLDTMSQTRTTLIIAHRLATVRNADTIIVLDKGRVVETGTHEALLAQDGTYAKLHALQFEN